RPSPRAPRAVAAARAARGRGLAPADDRLDADRDRRDRARRLDRAAPPRRRAADRARPGGPVIAYSSAESLTYSARPGRCTPYESYARASVRFWTSTVAVIGRAPRVA